MRRSWAAGAAVLACLVVAGLPALGQEASPPPSFAFRDTYAHPDALTDATWLVGHLDDPSVRIVDARMPFEERLYATGHIPGAIYVDVFTDVCCAAAIMPADPFARVMSRLGIGDDTTVVAYDTDGGLWAARLWWALRYHGHERAMMLNGGLRSWVSAGLPLETASPTVEPAVFTPVIQPRWHATIDEVRAAIDDPDVALVDALPWPVFTGDEPDFGAGHIPSAVNLSVSDAIGGIDKTITGPDVLSRMLARLGLDPADRTITYCGGGYAGAFDAFVLHLMGFDQVGLYDGALMEWTSDPSNPMETVPVSPAQTVP
jgi:thiosulfate/3-mercaptopyruvate sulfurtransferase